MKTHLLQVTFKNYAGYRLMRHCLYEVLRKVMPDSGGMEVALNEAVNNALLHGCDGVRHTRVTVKIDVIKGRRLIVRVEDSGEGFERKENLQNKVGFFETCCSGMMEESGRGLHIMQMLTDYMRYNKNGNEVLLMKKIDCEFIKTGGLNDDQSY